MSDTTDWPLGESISVTAVLPRPVERRPRLPRAVWALTAAAFVAGVLISAAGFSVGWRHQAQHGSSTEAALAAATARNHALATSLAGSRAALARMTDQLATAQRAKAGAVAASRAVSRDASTLASALVQTGRSADSVSAGAGSVGSNVDRLAGELRTLTTYLTTTPMAQLDAGYIATQTSYLSRQLDELKAARSDLAATITDFDATAAKLADRAATLAGTRSR